MSRRSRRARAAAPATNPAIDIEDERFERARLALRDWQRAGKRLVQIRPDYGAVIVELFDGQFIEPDIRVSRGDYATAAEAALAEHARRAAAAG